MIRFITSQRQLVFVWLTIAFVCLLWAALNSEGAYGGADSFVHYLIARYSWVDPDLFLDHWGKPIFTLLASPFAQIGFIGIRLFNIICALLSAYLASETARILGLQYYIIAAVFTLLAVLGIPVYLSGLTEPLFALTLMLAIYAGSRKNWVLSAIVISFIPLVRTEGLMFLPLWAVTLALSKKAKWIFLLLTGFILYSVIGVLSGKELFWLITDSPYGVGQLYGKGELLHFWNYREETFGVAFVLFFFLGVGWLLSQRRMLLNKSNSNLTWLIVLFSFIGYFTAHSLVWWLGRGSSAGLTRVMIGIVPLGAIVASAGFELISLTRFKPKIIASIIGVGIIFFQATAALPGHSNLAVPSKWGAEEEVLQQAVNFINSEGLDKEYIVYYNPIVAFMMSLNPFSTSRSREKVIDNHNPERELPLGTIVFYDNHFGPQEGALPKEQLNSNKQFKLVKEFVTTSNHRMPNGDLYAVYIYQKVKASN